MGTTPPRRINILMSWFAGEKTWNEGRTYQKVAEHLAVLPEVRRVIMTFPPPKSQGSYSFPLKIKHVSEKLVLITEHPEAVPANGPGFKLRRWINGLSAGHALTIYLRFAGFMPNNTVLWLFPPHPYLDSLIRRVPHALLVGHIVDNFTRHGDPWLNEYAQRQYPALQAGADVIFTGSRFNLDIFRQGRTGGAYLFENAVDEAFLGDPSATPISSEGPPRLGYVGTLSERTDLELLEHLALSRPDWRLLIAGKSEYPLAELPWLELPNVKYLGVLPYAELPSFLRGLDVCLIPHRNTEYSQSMSPLKLFQYLASGRPIVSSEVAGLEKAAGHVRLAMSRDDFVAAIDQTLKEDTLEMSARRIELARRETWVSRVSGMFYAVMSHMPDRK